MPDLQVGASIGGCRVEAVAGRGMRASVYRAVQLVERPVAVKVIDQPTDWERLTHAAQQVAAIDHPNLLPVYETGEHKGSLYVVEKWVEGPDLGVRIGSGGPLTALDAIPILRAVAGALAAVHDRGLIHGDVRPSNVLIDDGEAGHVYLACFGTLPPHDARGTALDADDDYAAPELVAGGSPTIASDIYAFGCLLFATVTGRAPSERPQVAIDPGLEPIMSVATAAAPDDRFGSAHELVIELERTQARIRGDLLGAAPVVRPEAAAPPAAEPPPVVAAAAPPPVVAAVPPPAADRRRSLAYVFAGPSSPATAAAIALALVALLLIVLAIAGVFSSNTRRAARGPIISTPKVPPPPATVTSGQLHVSREIGLTARGGDVSVAPDGIVWASVPSRDELVKVVPNRSPEVLHGIPDPGPIDAGAAAVWVTSGALHSVSRLAGRTVRHSLKLPGHPAAIALGDPAGNSVWVGDSSGAITRVSAHVTRLATMHLSPAATGMAVGEPNWLWVTDGGFVRIDPVALRGQTFDTGPRTTGVALDQGVWTSHANGDVTQFDPSTGAVVATLPLGTPLTAIAAIDGAPILWAISGRGRTLYEILHTPARLVGTVRFTSDPVAVAVTPDGVWVTTAGGQLIQIDR